MASGKRDGGLYVLERRNFAFISVLKNKVLHACMLVLDMLAILLFLY